MSSPFWPEDYFASRQKFIELGQSIGAVMESHAVSARGPQSELLSVDVASVTSEEDKHLIIITCGVHGVEGFLGAAVQIEFLQMLAGRGKPADMGIVLIHAANPWGYAHLRRVDENNIDVNRNFIDSSTKPSTTPNGYAALDPVINSQQPPALSGELKYWQKAFGLIVRNRGVGRLFATIAQGQYDFPKGVFYGGLKTGESCQLLQNLVTRFAADVDMVSVLDIHSGLGRSGTAMLIGNTNTVSEDKRKRWIQKLYNKRTYLDNDANNAYDATGTFSLWCQKALRHKRYLYLCIEVGTVNPITLFSAMRRENQAHHWAKLNSKAYYKTKNALRAVFAPHSLRWKRKSITQAMDVVEKTMRVRMEK